jgi:hypothetical protein
MNNYLKLEYPYYNLYHKLNKNNIKILIKNYKPVIFKNIPNNLKSKFNLDKYDNNYFIIKENYLENEIINNLTDFFSEKVRVKCQFSNNISPYFYWNKNKNKILKLTIQKYNKINIYYIREIIYENTKLCNNFRITVSLTILRNFKVKKWLDISAGWGDRLLSAIFHNVNIYESCDPNLELHDCYNDIIQNFVSEKKKNNFIIHKNGFLESIFINNNFDVVFSSPPFFSLEKYSSFNENSITKFKNEKEWCQNFFIKSLIKAYNLLKKNGYMILYMGGSNYVIQQMHLLDKIMDYKGIIYFYEKTPRKIYVWKKLKNDKIENLL